MHCFTDEVNNNDIAAHRRDLHAYRYVVYIRSLVALLMLIVVAISTIEPGLVGRFELAIVSSVVVTTAAFALAARYLPSVRVAVASLLVDALIISIYLLRANEPHERATLLILPIIGVAYFLSPRAAIMTGFSLAAYLFILSNYSSNWAPTVPLAPSVYTLIFATVMLAFVTRQSRRTESALTREYQRSFNALSITKRIKSATTPFAALIEIAEQLGQATNARLVVATAIDIDRKQITDCDIWTHNRDNPDIDNSQLNHLLFGLIDEHYALIISHDEVQSVSLDTKAVFSTPKTQLDRERKQIATDLLYSLDLDSAFVAPLVLSDQIIGAVILGGTPDIKWLEDPLSLFREVSPFIAAALGQVLLMRDQLNALRELERVDRVRNQLLANVSHELRTPLTSTIGFLETALRTDINLDEASKHEFITLARDGGYRLLALVEDLLSIASLKPESLRVNLKLIRLKELIKVALHDTALPDDRNVVVEIDNVPEFHGDENRLLQVLTNLITNASRYGNGFIGINCRCIGGFVEIDVTDNGIGVDPSNEAQLFLPFARFNSMTDSTGLGLAISRAIVEAHQGSITYRRISDRQLTSFLVKLPLDPILK